MRTLKKALSLVLVLAMVLSLGVSAFAADASTTLKDFNEVTNKEAVSVLTSIGVISGRDNGNYDPKGTFNRAEAATIIARMLLGPTVAEVLPVAATQFDDVPSTHWASKYIAYCASEGIISGYGDGKFGPNDTLTATQWALMVLKAIKADGVSEVGGSSWAITTTKLALNTKVAAANDLTGTFNRDVAAKMAFNGLNYSEKKETKTETKYVVTATGGASTQVFDTWADAKAELDAHGGTIASVSVTSEKAIDSVGYKVFTLEKTSATSDDYGRPGQGWQFKNANGKTEQIGKYGKTPVAVYTNTVSANELYNALGANAIIDASASFVNTTTQAAGYVKADGTVDASNDITVSAKSVAIGGNGIVTEIYEIGANAVNPDKTDYKVVQIKPTLTQVKNVRNVKATATEGAYTAYTFEGDSTVYKVYTSTVTAADKDTVTINGTVAKSDYVMVYGAAGNVIVNPVTLVEGNVSGYTSSTKSYTIGGSTYALSAAKPATGVTATLPAVSATKGTFAVDTYGYVIGAVELSSAQYVYVLTANDILHIDGNRATTVLEATVVTTDGEMKNVVVSKVDSDTTISTMKATLGTAADKTGNTKANLYTYKIDGDGNYELTAATTGATAVSAIKKGDPKLETGLNANNATKFFVAQYSDKGAVTSVSSFTGYSSVMSLTSATAKALDVNGDGIAEVVFVGSATEAGATTSYVYYTGNYTVGADNKTYYKVISKDGAAEEMTLTFKSGSETTAGLYTIDAGKASLVDTAAALNITNGTTGVYVTKTYLSYDNGLLKTSADDDNYTVLAGISDNVPVYYYDKGEVDTSVTAASDLSGTDGSTIVITVNSAKTAIEAIYIVK